MGPGGPEGDDTIGFFDHVYFNSGMAETNYSSVLNNRPVTLGPDYLLPLCLY